MSWKERGAPYGHLLMAQLRSQVSYRASFALDVVVNAVFTGIDVIVLVALFRANPALGGFTFPEGAADLRYCWAGLRARRFGRRQY